VFLISGKFRLLCHRTEAHHTHMPARTAQFLRTLLLASVLTSVTPLVLPALPPGATSASSTPTDETASPDFGDLPIRYAALVRTTPRPLRIHTLQLDLQHQALAIDVQISPDPDGTGDAETTLTAPLDHAKSADIVAAVNANAWSMLPTLPGGLRPGYVVGGACDVHGWVLRDSTPHSPPEPGYWSLWFDSSNRGHIGSIRRPPAHAIHAVAGFGGLLQDGKLLPEPSDVIHPRTAAGLDETGRYLTLVVVDGRQPGYSEGMSTRELAELMAELGCTDALNLDGGGSTIMLWRDASHTVRIINRPSDAISPRPIPVLLGVRARPNGKRN
jgi:hypothetical protein